MLPIVCQIKNPKTIENFEQLVDAQNFYLCGHKI